jgi:glutamate-1-semialdehyde 2,1-aminomutase
MTLRAKSEQLFAEAVKYIPGGVNSPVRAFRAVGGQPFFVNKAKGARVWDVDGNAYIDYVGTWGPAILGHAHPKIIKAVRAAAQDGTSFGIPNPFEVTLAKMICSWVPSVQKVRMCNSGTEATMSAIRLARGFTKRDKIIKFDGCYHGHADSLLVKAGSGALTFGNPDSAGVPAAFTQHTISLPFNDQEAVTAAFAANKNQVAGIIVEPVPGNAGLYLPKDGYLEFLREITTANGALLLFDEVMTGFRLAKGGAQERFGIAPDLSCFGKVIGGGLPVGAFGGLAASNAYAKLEELGAALEEGMKSAAKTADVAVQFNRCGSMFCGYFTSEPVHNVADAMKSDRERFRKYFHGMLAEGIYFAPSQFEAGFLSTAHTPADLKRTVKAAAKVMKTL